MEIKKDDCGCKPSITNSEAKLTYPHVVETWLEKLIEYWNQNEPSVDIGPMPWGDGVVDEEDLEVLMSHWEQEVDDPTLIACWKLDETEGDIACDSVSQNDALVSYCCGRPTI